MTDNDGRGTSYGSRSGSVSGGVSGGGGSVFKCWETFLEMRPPPPSINGFSAFDLLSYKNSKKIPNEERCWSNCSGMQQILYSSKSVFL